VYYSISQYWTIHTECETLIKVIASIPNNDIQLRRIGYFTVLWEGIVLGLIVLIHHVK